MNNNKNKLITIDIPAEYYEALERVAKNNDECIGEILRRAIAKEVFTDNSAVKIIIGKNGKWKEVAF